LADAEHVAFAVAKPRGPLAGAFARIVACHVGDTVDSFQAGYVDVFENNPAPA
jgi:hypothetical protein